MKNASIKIGRQVIYQVKIIAAKVYIYIYISAIYYKKGYLKEGGSIYKLT